MLDDLKISVGVKTTLVGAGVNIVLAVVKFAGGTAGKSAALTADAFHSLSDLLTDVVVLLTYQIGRIPKDEGHPYGHGRAETIGAVLIGSAIILTGLGLLYAGYTIILSGRRLVPEWIAAVCALISIASKEAVFRYTKNVGKKIHSPSITANAWHHRSDAFSSIACLIGIVGAKYGHPIMDPIAGVAVAALVVKAGYNVLAEGLRDLMDASLEAEEIERAKNAINSTPGVKRFHELRTRRIGGEILMDVHILVDPEISVSEGHNIAENVRHKLMTAFENVQDALVHVDAEDMEEEKQYGTTKEELKKLAEPIVASTNGIRGKIQMRAHYLDDKNIVEIFVRVDENKTLEETKKILSDLKTRLEAVDKIDEARVYLDMDF